MNCLFCSIISGNIPCHKIYEDELVLAFLDIGPVSDGHTLVIPKTHAENLQAGSLGDAEQLMKVIYNISPAIMKAVGANGYNLGMNHGECAGQDVMHTHIHIMPRHNGTPRTFIKKQPTQAELAIIAEAIRAAMRE